jgi:type I restriction enzyme S subunit
MNCELPSGWELSSLDQVTEPATTVDPRKRGQAFNYIDVSAIAAGKIRNGQSLEAERAPSRAKQLVKLGDTLFSGVRVYLKNIALVDDVHDGSIASTAFCVLRPKAALDPRYLFFFVNSQKFIGNLLPLQRGNSPPAVLDSDIKAQPIPIAPLNEQRRIVTRIEDLFVDIEEGEASLRRARQGLDTWRRALLKAAVTGELTRDWREANRPAETGVDLLARICAERESACPNRSRGRRGTAAEPLDISVLRQLPEGWVWARLHELGDVTGGLTKNPDREGFPNKLPYLRVANVQMGRLDLTEVTEIGIRPEEQARLLLKDNDLLIVEGNGSVDQIGRCALWSGEIQPCLHQNHIIKVRFSEPILSSWALRWLLSPYGREAIETVASSTSGLHTLSISKIQNLPIPVPPREEAFIALTVVEEQLAAASDAESHSKKLTGDRIALRRAILKAAFEGRLVPQDPNDEPASVLLDGLRDSSLQKGMRRRPPRVKEDFTHPSLPGLTQQLVDPRVEPAGDE